MLLSGEFDPPVAGTALERVVGLNRSRRAKAVCGEAIRGNVIASDKGLFHGSGAALRQVKVVVVAADVIGVAFNC